MEIEREALKYFVIAQRWMTPSEFDELRKAMGSADDMLEFRGEIKQLVKDAERRRMVWAFMRSAALAFATAVGVLATVKALLPAGWTW